MVFSYLTLYLPTVDTVSEKWIVKTSKDKHKDRAKDRTGKKDERRTLM